MYGYGWVGVSVFAPSLPEMVHMVEDRVLAGKDESVTEFQKSQESQLSNIGITVWCIVIHTPVFAFTRR